MSEVKRYRFVSSNGYAAIPVVDSVKAERFVEEHDFDRVTAERDAALAREAALTESHGRLEAKLSCLNGHVLAYKLSRQRLLGRARARELLVSELQQRLTAADERVDVLEGLLRTSLIAMKRIYQAGYDRIIDAGGACDTPEYMMAQDPAACDIRAALKPAEVKCGVCGQGAWACSEGGCHYLEGGNGEPAGGRGDEAI